MANFNDLESVLEQLNSKDIKNFSELDRVFESIVNENSKDLIKSINLLEEFFASELQKIMTKEV